MPDSFTLDVNGKTRKIEASKDTPLLYVLRNNLGLTGPKFGCGMGQCGACMVLVNEEVSYSCQMRSGRLSSFEITTLEGLSESEDPIWKVVESAFWNEQAAQCGYCTNGMMIAAVALLRKIPNPSDQQIERHLQGNLCRCGTYSRVMAAIKSAVRTINK
ncbi:UNVERIFIED_CONTAM: hypothetical protein GTU68_057002 [Idotea baltica]|nr:hypothetical protein [Idotea baltica]